MTTATRPRFTIVNEPPLVREPAPASQDLKDLARVARDNPGKWVMWRPPVVPPRGRYSNMYPGEMCPDRNLMKKTRYEINSGSSREFGQGFRAECRDSDGGEDPRMYVKYVGRIKATEHQRTTR